MDNKIEFVKISFHMTDEASEVFYDCIWNYMHSRGHCCGGRYDIYAGVETLEDWKTVRGTIDIFEGAYELVPEYRRWVDAHGYQEVSVDIRYL